MQKTVVFAVTSFFVAVSSFAGDFKVDPAHSQVGFTVSHLGISSVSGQFKEFQATVRLDPKDLSTLSADAVIQIGSVDTRESDRDAHLRSADFFDAEKHPTMRFVSKRAEVVDDAKVRLHGDLTIRGTTKPIVLDVDFRGAVKGPMGNEVAVLSANATINRKDFGVSWNRFLDAGGLVVGENVEIQIQLELSREVSSD